MTSRLCAGRGATRRCSTARDTCRPICGCCGSARRSSGSIPSRRPRTGAAPPDDVLDRPRRRGRRRGAERALVSLIGPRPRRSRAPLPRPEFGSAETTVGAIAALAVGTRDGIDLFADSAQAERPTRRAARGGRRRGRARGGRDRSRRGRGAPLRRRDGRSGRCPPRPAIVEDAVSFTKGCYIGQETVARLHYKGRPNRQLRGLRLSAAAAPGTPLRLGEKEVGTLGGAVVSPALGPIGLAIVRREAESGDRITVGEDGVTAELSPSPSARFSPDGSRESDRGGRLRRHAGACGTGCGAETARERAPPVPPTRVSVRSPKTR